MVSSPLPQFRSQTRGAIVVVAVFMSAVLVGALWYVIGIAEAILQRQQLQDAADAAAYAAAVTHARGMNLMALLNVVMAAILAVLVALKLVEILNLAALVLSCSISSLCSVGVGCWATPICAYATDLRPEISAAITRYERGPVFRLLPVLADLQHSIAVSSPPLAQRHAAAVGRSHFFPRIQASGVVSTSLAPDPVASRPQLPVRQGSPATLCGRAARASAQVAFAPFPFAQWLRGVTQNLVESYPGQFCGTSGGPSVAEDPGAVAEQCELRQQVHEAESDEEFDLDQCRRDVARELEEQYRRQTEQWVAVKPSPSVPVPLQLLDDVENGGAKLQIWSIVVADTSVLRSSGQGVAAATPNRGAGRETSALLARGQLGFAQSEYYYDTEQSFAQVREEALWNMRWKARLRRVRPPPRAARRALNEATQRLPQQLRQAVATVTQSCTLPLVSACRPSRNLSFAGEVIH
jgi:hypothetical protein